MMIQNWCIFHAIFGMLSPNGLGWTRLMGEISTQHDFSQLWLESAWENCPIHIIQAMVIVIDIIEVTLRFYIFWWCIWIYVWDCLCILGGLTPYFSFTFLHFPGPMASKPWIALKSLALWALLLRPGPTGPMGPIGPIGGGFSNTTSTWEIDSVNIWSWEIMGILFCCEF